MNKSKIKTKVNLKKLRYNNNKKVGEGSFGAVYDLHNNKRTNKKYVVKKYGGVKRINKMCNILQQ